MSFTNYECPTAYKQQLNSGGLCVSDAPQAACEFPNYKKDAGDLCVGPGNPYCNSEGKKFRSVTCVKDIDGSVVDASKCAGSGAKPVTTDSCLGGSPITFSWVDSAWGDCDPNTKKQSRIVGCKDNKGNVASYKFCTDFGAGPEHASSQTCVPPYHWVVGPWKAVEGYEAEKQQKGFFARHWLMILIILIAVLAATLLLWKNKNKK